MKIAFLSVDDPADYRSWSGLKLNMFKTLKSLNHQVDPIGPLRNKFRLPFILKREIFNLFKIKYDSERKYVLSRGYAKKIEKILKKKNYDLIFTSDSFLISFLNTSIPIVLWIDATYKTYYDHYFKGITRNKKSFNEANKLEKLALDKARNVILTSNWSKKKAIKTYKIKSQKIHIIPFGSNIDNVKKYISKNKSRKVCKLISVGVDWKRKGMDKSIKITKLMNKKGTKTHLKIIGPSKNKFSNYQVSQYGFLDKNKFNHIKKLIRLYNNSDFHILMTEKEACGVVFAEANMFGLYNITNNVGGVGGMIKNNINGKMFSKNESIDKIQSFGLK